MPRYYFSFGHGHYDDNHDSLGDHYTVIDAPSDRDARTIMCSVRADKWRMIHEVPDLMHRRNLKHIEFKKLTAQKGKTK